MNTTCESMSIFLCFLALGQGVSNRFEWVIAAAAWDGASHITSQMEGEMSSSGSKTCHCQLCACSCPWKFPTRAAWRTARIKMTTSWAIFEWQLQFRCNWNASGEALHMQQCSMWVPYVWDSPSAMQHVSPSVWHLPSIGIHSMSCGIPFVQIRCNDFLVKWVDFQSCHPNHRLTFNSLFQKSCRDARLIESPIVSQ